VLDDVAVLEEDALGDLPPLRELAQQELESIEKCLNSSSCALRMIAAACSSCSRARRCAYQPIASASSVSEASILAIVRASCGSSSGGSWYWSKPMRRQVPRLVGR
jgi:hypothetical protein